jgi:hypothetical protein
MIDSISAGRITPVELVAFKTERAVRALGFEFDGAGRADICRGNFGSSMLEALGHHDLNAVRLSRHRILDRLDLGLQHALRHHTRNPAIRDRERVA